MGKEDKSLIDEILDSEKDDDDNNNDDEGSLESLKQEVSELKKERDGLYAATKAERSKRQAVSNRLEQLEGAVSNILSERQKKGMESLTVSQTSEATKKGLPVVYDDDGNAFVDQNAVTNLISPYEKKITELEDKLQQTSNDNAASSAAEKVRQSIIGEDERYGSANSRYRAARKWVEDVVFDFTKENGINKSLTSGEALDYVFDKTLRHEFKDKFKDLDIVDIVTAEDSQDHFRRMLNNISSIMNPKNDTKTTPRMDSRFQKVLEKPSSLGNKANAKAGQLSIMDKLDNLSTKDIMDLSDSEIETLMKAVHREEVEDGIKF